ncbi:MULTISPECIES: L,D-transpeptidase family protein [unclassified Streptomyces]|uniref:L,D-transpeptidase family protein n=1 Tax=unclassified Streptomyces TaxID=2593676 RepID=UPI0006AFAE5C|nr:MULTISPECIES: L,D-transpeptidase family protein [unclassified Streptomyces]KOX26583.1 peptidoglycan-binding protein [Streptomyces sp. NRRL F-6491]KOX50001.1 peptidoglycan-binding protein [Streptomyces sp. NRRL F-6492]
MKRSSAVVRRGVVRRVVLAAVSVALVAGCTAQAAGTGGGGSAGPSGSSSPKPSASASDSVSPSASESASGSPGASPTADGEAPSSSPSFPTPEPSGTDSGTPASPVLLKDGDENERVRELQARLRQLGVFDRAPTGFYGTMTGGAVKAFQRKQGLPGTGSVDETTWQRLLAASRKPTADELKPATTNALDAPAPACTTGRVLCISKESRTLAWMIDGKVVSSMDVRFGSENTPTREGTFSVGWKAREWTSTIYHTPMPYAMFFSGGQAVHYSADFAARGYAGASHGCVNVRDRAKLAALFDQVKVGDKVVVHW